MSIMATEEKNNQALILALPASNSQPTASSLIFPLTPPSGTAASSSVASNKSDAKIATLPQAYSAKNAKLNSIIKKRGIPSISEEGSYEASSAVPNAHTTEVTLKQTSDMEESSDNPRKELDSHARIVFLGSNSVVFELIGRT